MTGSAGAIGASLRRLWAKPLQALLSVLGIAAGVALAYAIGAANTTLTGGYDRLQRELAGDAQLELAARAPRGLSQSLVARAEQAPGVKTAVPLLEREVRLRHGGRATEVRLLGVDRRARDLGSGLARAVPAAADERALGLHLPAAVAESLGVAPGSEIIVEAGGRRSRTAVAAVLSDDRAGVLRSASAAVAPLPLAQELSGSTGAQRVLVRVEGDPASVRPVLERLAGPSASVRPVGEDTRLLEQASSVSNQGTALFAGLSLVVGGLLAYSAMALSVTDRRREVATLRALGCGIGALVVAAVVEALLIGGVGSVLGLAVGRVALLELLEPGTRHLAAAFFLAPATHAPLAVAGVSALAGLLTSLTAAALPTRALTRVSPAAALRPEAHEVMRASGALPRRLAIAGAVLMAVALGAEAASAAIVSVPLWALGGALLVPLAVQGLTHALRRGMPRPAGAAQLGAAEIAAFPGRAAAVAGVVTLAVAGVVTFGGAVSNLESGTNALAESTFRRGDLWVALPGRDNVFLTRTFDRRLVAGIERLDSVRTATPLRTAFVDWGDRKVYAFGFDFRRGDGLGDSEVIRGDAAALAHDPRAVGLSHELARVKGIDIGERFTLPTPSGARRVRLVAMLTNYGWQPGAVAMPGSTFARWWGHAYVGGIALRLSGAVPVATAEHQVRDALSGTGLEVVTAAALRGRIEKAADAGLQVLRRIAVLVALASLLAVSSAMLVGVLQRIRRIAALRAIGMSARQLGSALLVEVALLAAVGLALGIPVGLGGQALVVHHLQVTTSYPASFAAAGEPLLFAVAAVSLVAAAATLVPLRWASRAPIGRAFGDA